jgi:chromatin remodeling complex protein RSC6
MEHCLICHEDFELNYIKLDCNHSYCTECFKAWFKSNKHACCFCFKNFTTFKEVKESTFEELTNRINDFIFKGEYKPVKISTELADFLGINVDKPIKREQVTKMVYAYIKEHNLFFDDKPNTIIKPDNKLLKLFGDFSHPIDSKHPELGNGLSIYNMKMYLQDHITPI